MAEGKGLTAGIKNALAKRDHHCMCGECGFALPRYPGRYPKSCPSCGETLPMPESKGVFRKGASAIALGENVSTGASFYFGDDRYVVVEVAGGTAYVEDPRGEISEVLIS